MKKRIGEPPEGVLYPVWAWYRQNGKHRKPDLRSERWDYGPGNEQYACIEFETPDHQVLLSDFDAWSIILNNGLITETEAESDALDALYDAMEPDQKRIYRENNWERVFNIAPLSNDWMTRGDWVQATTWELRKEMVCDVRFFMTGTRKW